MNKIKKIWMLIFATVAILAIVCVIYINDSLNYKKNLIPKNNVVLSAESYTLVDSIQSLIQTTNSNINILFLGIDKSTERESWLGFYRTDTIDIARINLDTKKIKVLSIPRDTYTYIPVENKLDRINHAYAFGSLKGNGVQTSIDAINYFIGKNIVDYYFLMDMEPIPSIVDQIGGVEIDVEVDMKDHGANLSKGLQLLNGNQVFDYIHWRYSAGGDIDRIKRQQKFVSALFKQQRDSGHILQTAQIVIQHKNDIITDLNREQIVGLAKFMSDIPDGSITYYYIPGDGEMIDGISYWVPYKNNTAEVLKEFFQ